MTLLGKIVRLQVQRSSLKRIQDGRKHYDPAPIVAVDELILTQAGASARAPADRVILDVHNAAHPSTRNDHGVNPLSFVFTSHYARMQERFGPHLAIGCAGESILIDTPGVVTPGDVAGGLTIETRDGPVELGSVIVAAPCAPFSAYALRQAEAKPEALKATLQFLDHGMRGFYCQFAGERPRPSAWATTCSPASALRPGATRQVGSVRYDRWTPRSPEEIPGATR